MTCRFPRQQQVAYSYIRSKRILILVEHSPEVPADMRYIEVHRILQKAVNSKALMFCSAPDEGNFASLDYPSGPWRKNKRFFRIGAASAHGQVFDLSPEDGITFVLPGVDVVKDEAGGNKSLSGGITGRVKDFRYETGSSVATALAAGLAAMIICCVKASILALMTANQNQQVVGLAINNDGAETIVDTQAMMEAFRSLGHVTSNNFIQVWDELDNVTTMLQEERLKGLTLKNRQHRTVKFTEFVQKLTKAAKHNRSNML